MSKRYLVFVWGDVEPEIMGPFTDADDRNAMAGMIRAREGDEHGLYRLDIDEQGVPSIGAFGGGEMEELQDAAQWLIDHSRVDPDIVEGGQKAWDAYLEQDYEDRQSRGENG